MGWAFAARIRILLLGAWQRSRLARSPPRCICSQPLPRRSPDDVLDLDAVVLNTEAHPLRVAPRIGVAVATHKQ